MILLTLTAFALLTIDTFITGIIAFYHVIKKEIKLLLQTVVPAS